MDPRPDLSAVFEVSPNPYMVLDRELRFVAANAAYLKATMARREDLIGRRVLDVFPHDPAHPDNANARRIGEWLRRVLETGRVDVLPLIP